MNRADLKHLVYIQTCLILMLFGIILIHYTFLFGVGLFFLIIWVMVVIYSREISKVNLTEKRDGEDKVIMLNSLNKVS